MELGSPRRSPWKKIVLIVGIVIIVLAIPLIWIYLLYPTTSPFKAISYYIYRHQHPHVALSSRVIGYAPSWQLGKLSNLHLEQLSDLIYFSLTVDGSGNFAKTDSNGSADAGWSAWNGKTWNDLLAKSQIEGDKTGLTISLLKNSQISSFLASSSSENNLIDNTVSAARSKHLKIINLDFEYSGEPPANLPPEFTSFVAQMKSQLNSKVPGCELDINLMARSGRDPGLFEIDKLSSSVDNFIVMSYDYYTAGFDSAGPTAPIGGFTEKKYFFDVSTTYSDLLKLLPASKIIMGVPYYGYDWPVKDKTNPRSLALTQSDANGYVDILSYGRARDDSTFSGSNCQYDQLAQQPWCGYTDPSTGKDRVAWFENTESIAAKFNLAKSQNLSGVAIWSLGYDKDYPDLWNLLQETFGK